MNFLYTQEDPNPRTIVLEHRGEQMEWNIAKLSKTNAQMNMIITDIGQYFQKLSMPVQDQLWELYSDAYEAIRETIDTDRLHRKLKTIASKIYELLPYQSFATFVQNDAKIKYPQDLRLQYGEGAPKSPLTYLRNEYYELLVLVVYIRPMLPIWGEYIATITDESGAQYKEYRAMKLLQNTPVIHCAPYIRLQEYISAFVGNKDAPIEAILGSLGTEEVPDWLLAIALIRRLAFCELVTERDRMDPTNVVSNIYNYIRTKLDSLPKTFGGNVRDKKPMGRADRGNGEDNTSVPELYKMKEPITEGSTVAIMSYLSNPIKVAKHIDKTIPQQLVQQCLRNLKQNKHFAFYPDQLSIIQYCLSSAIPARGIPHLEYDSMINATAITQALLWHKGLVDLAIIVASEAVEVATNFFVGTQKLKLEGPRVDALLERYPHVQPQRNVKKDTLLNRQKQNVACKAIEDITESLDSVAWQLNAPADLLSVNAMVKVEEGYKIPPSIKLQLADLILIFCK